MGSALNSRRKSRCWCIYSELKRKRFLMDQVADTLILSATAQFFLQFLCCSNEPTVSAAQVLNSVPVKPLHAVVSVSFPSLSGLRGIKTVWAVQMFSGSQAQHCPLGWVWEPASKENNVDISAGHFQSQEQPVRPVQMDFNRKRKPRYRCTILFVRWHQSIKTERHESSQFTAYRYQSQFWRSH